MTIPPLPISNVRLPGGIDLGLTGLTVVVGPNSSGKTQLLRDINGAICGHQRKLTVATEIAYATRATLEEYLKNAVEHGDMTERRDAQQAAHYRRQRHQLGLNDGSTAEYTRRDLEGRYEEFARRGPTASGELVMLPFLQVFGGLTCSSLFLDSRLALLTDAGAYDYTTTPPANLVQALFIDKTARRLFEEELQRVFDRCVWLDYTRANQLILLASDPGRQPSHADRLEPEEMRKFRALSSEGDGLRSYAAVCATLLLSQRPLCLIDEPELCLHPPQAYAMGRLIGLHAKKRGHGTIVSTHSSHVLRGILSTGGNIPVLRLVRIEGEFAASRVDGEKLAGAIRNPRSRAEAALDGLLADGVVLCEAEGDRVVYEAAHRRLERPRDLRFVGTTGISGCAELVRLYRALKVPVAVIGDIDILVGNSSLASIMDAAGMEAKDVANVRKFSRGLTEYLRETPSGVSKEDLVSTLQRILAMKMEWEEGDDLLIRRALRDAGDSLSRTRSIQTQGIAMLSEELAREARAILQLLKDSGVFVVPVGTLESWLPTLMVDVGKGNKAAWADTAAQRLEDAATESCVDIVAFITEVDAAINVQIGRLAATTPAYTQDHSDESTKT